MKLVNFLTWTIYNSISISLYTKVCILTLLQYLHLIAYESLNYHHIYDKKQYAIMTYLERYISRM